MRLFEPETDIEITTEQTTGMKEDDGNVDYKSLSESIEQLNSTVQELNAHLALQETSEVSSEEVSTEEGTTEEILEEDLPVTKGDITLLNESITNMSESIDGLVKLQEESNTRSTEVSTEASTTSIVYEDETVDTHMYLSTPVENATTNDIYTLGLSIRNVLLLFLLIWICFKVFGLLRAAVDRVMNR